MNYETLNNNVMLVELTCEDMKKLSLTYESFDNKELTSTAVKKILKEIPHKADTKSKITVDALPTNDGGCFFIFTFSTNEKQRYKLKKLEPFWYRTENIDNLLDVISLSEKLSDFKTESQIFKYNNHYYLSLSPDHKRLFPLMKEFGRILNFPSQEIVSEYGDFLGQVRI